MGTEIYALFYSRLNAGWLVGTDSQSIIDRANHKLADLTESQPDFISISTTDLTEFIASFMAGCQLGLPIFLCNPDWGEREWAQVSVLTSQVNPHQHHNLIMIPTGGSTGEVKFAMHTWETLSASAWGFQEFYSVAKINAVCTLPLYHVSGLSQLVRSIITNGQLLVTNFQQFYTKPNLITNQIEVADYFISLVPTQLTKLLDLDLKLLSQFKTILLGGAPPTTELLSRARNNQLPLALTYGMTETGSQITSLKPVEFLAGNQSCGRVLPHAKITFRSPGGEIQVEAKSLMLGYFPAFNLANYFESDDMGLLDVAGYLTIIGRSSIKIITGGENVFPIEIVDAIMATGLVADAWVIGLPDQYWGQIVVALYVENNIPVASDQLSLAIAGKISKYKIPKQWISVPRIPRNSLGKVLINELKVLVQSLGI